MVVAGLLTAMAMGSKTAAAFGRPSLAVVARARTAVRSTNAIVCSNNANIHAHRGRSRLFASVTGSVYESDTSPVVVTLYTKEGCTLCDKVKDVLQQVRDGGSDDFAHSLKQIDITDADQQDSYDRYKYDIPVLHMSLTGESDSDGEVESVYWTKHRLTEEEAKEAIREAKGGSFASRKGRPNASAMER
jgi:glutaredoxin